MAQEEVTTAEIQPGKPVASEIFRKLKANIEDHETRVTATEAGALENDPICFDVTGVLNVPFSFEQILKWRSPKAFTATAVRLYAGFAGSSGVATIDIEYKRGVGAWTSILTEPLSLDYSEGDEGVASGVLAVTDFQAGDWFRLNIDSVQAGMVDLYAQIENEVA